MRRLFIQLRAPAIISTLLVLPFAGLELINRQSSHHAFPFSLFGLLWVLPLTFIVTLIPLIRTVRKRDWVMGQPVNLVLRFGVLMLVAWLWISILVDQMPCFLGVPNCD